MAPRISWVRNANGVETDKSCTPFGAVSQGILLKNFDFSGVHVVHGADDLDLAVLFHLSQQRTTLANRFHV